jgi:hypothetical protein
MWNSASQDKQSSIKPKCFIAMTGLLSSLGGFLRSGGKGEFNLPEILTLGFCQSFFCIQKF